ncbi:MAG: hypothetical protein H6838_07840 [Planctomycetes bacterium]|nr:hypothetical protein [Planctomycetota bacterium]
MRSILLPAILLGLTVPAFAQTVASYTLYGEGCNGAASNNCLSLNDVNPVFTLASLPNEYAYPVINTTGIPIQIVGFEIYTQTNTSQTETVNTGLLYDNSGPTATVHTSPAATNVANGTITVDASPNWYSTSVYPPITIPAGGAFWFHVDAYSKVAPPQHSTTGGVPGPTNNYYRRPSNNMVWTNSVSVARQIFRIHCKPATPTVPSLAATGAPQLGTNFSLQVSGGTPNLPAFVIYAFDNTQWLTLPTPVDLALFGAPNCFNQTSNDFVSLLLLDAAGQGTTLPLAIPSAPAFNGLTWYNQAAALTPGVNAIDLLVTNAGTAVVGN